MTKTVRVGIIGCGRVAGHHARSISTVPNLKLVAVCDLKPERGNEIGKAHEVEVFTNYHEMMKKHSDIDVVAIVTPSGMHFEHAMDIMERYKKHVVVEKPVVMTLTQGKQLRDTAQRAGVRVFPVYQYRFNKAVQRIRQATRKSDEIGNVVLATVRTRWCRPQSYYDRDAWRGTYALDGGACTNQGIHHLDLLRYLAGEVKRVNVSMKTMGANIEVEDTVVGTLEFESGAMGVIEITTAARPTDFESSISVVGTKGLAMVGGWATNELIQFSINPEEQKNASEQFPDVYGFGHKKIYADVYNFVAEGKEPEITLEDGLKSIALLHAIYVSDETKSWVNVAEGRESSRLGRPDDRLANQYRTKA